MACSATAPALSRSHELTAGHALLCLEIFAPLLRDVPQLQWLLDRRAARESLVRVLARAVALHHELPDGRVAPSRQLKGPSPSAALRRIRSAAAEADRTDHPAD